MKRFEGKLFGAALGFTFGGPIGALIGAAAGHLYDTSVSGKSSSMASQKELAFITSLILLLSGTAKADGKVTESEINTIKNFFKHQLGYGPAEYLFIERIINESFHKNVNLVETCDAINKRTSYEERLFLVRLNYQVAVSDGNLHRNEEAFIEQASKHLGIETYDYAMIKNQFTSYKRASGSKQSGSKQSIDEHEITDPYTLLGLEPRCTDEDVIKSYRNLASKYHPDKVSHLGKEFIDLATKKFTRIQEAYEEIKKERGLG